MHHNSEAGACIVRETARQVFRTALPAIVIVAVLWLLVWSVPSVHSYFTDWDQAVNRLSVGRNDVTIVEDFPDPGITPGKTVKKEVAFKNTGNVDCYVRAWLLFDSSEADQQTELVLGSGKWIRGDDDAYYYTDVVAPGETTEVLLSAVRMKDSLSVNGFDLTVYTETVQSEGFDNARAAFSHLMGKEDDT